MQSLEDFDDTLSVKTDSTACTSRPAQESLLKRIDRVIENEKLLLWQAECLLSVIEGKNSLNDKDFS